MKHICAEDDIVFVVSTSIVFQQKSISNLLLKFIHPNCKKATFFAFLTVVGFFEFYPMCNVISTYFLKDLWEF